VALIGLHTLDKGLGIDEANGCSLNIINILYRCHNNKGYDIMLIGVIFNGGYNIIMMLI
jgi:hypothetical protein